MSSKKAAKKRRNAGRGKGKKPQSQGGGAPELGGAETDESAGAALDEMPLADRESALQFAIRAGLHDVAKEILDAGPDTEKLATAVPFFDAAEGGYSMLALAARRYCPDCSKAICELLLDAGAHVEGEAGTREVRPLIAAVAGGHADAILLLLGRGASTDARDDAGRAAYLLAAKCLRQGREFGQRKQALLEVLRQSEHYGSLRQKHKAKAEAKAVQAQRAADDSAGKLGLDPGAVGSGSEEVRARRALSSATRSVVGEAKRAVKAKVDRRRRQAEKRHQSPAVGSSAAGSTPAPWVLRRIPNNLGNRERRSARVGISSSDDSSEEEEGPEGPEGPQPEQQRAPLPIWCGHDDCLESVVFFADRAALHRHWVRCHGWPEPEPEPEEDPTTAIESPSPPKPLPLEVDDFQPVERCGSNSPMATAASLRSKDAPTPNWSATNRFGPLAALEEEL